LFYFTRNLISVPRRANLMIRIVMETAKPPLLLSCPDCDALFSAPVVRENERVICPQCRANLFSRRPNFVHRATALVFAAAFFFILANTFPFLTLQANYRQSSMHLVGCVSGLDAQGFHLLAAMVGVFTLAAPTLLIAGLLYILVPLLRGRRLPFVKHGAGAWWKCFCSGWW
jgi:paraquat-inducible protein A